MKGYGTLDKTSIKNLRTKSPFTSVWGRTVKQVPMEGTGLAILLKFQTRRKWRVKRQAVSVSAATFQLRGTRLEPD